jgi:hypothetical protein
VTDDAQTLKITPDELKSWRTLCEKATAERASFVGTRFAKEDAALAVAARTAMPRLLDECERLREYLGDTGELDGVTRQDGSGGGLHQTLLNSATRIDRDEQDGLLPEDEGDLRGQLLCAAEEVGAAAADRTHHHLGHVAVLGAALPNAARLEEGRVLEPAPDRTLDAFVEDVRIERDRQPLVAADSAGYSGSDVEAHCAGWLDGHAPSISAKPDASKEALERRAGRVTHRFYLYFEVERSTGQISIETSWLPDMPEVNDALVPLGFRRQPDGSYCVELSDVDDHVGILRRATKAIALLIEEAML